MDLIDRQALLDALHDRLCHPKTPKQSPGIAAAEKLVKKQPAIQPKRGAWISVKDRLPPKAGYYLVYATVYFTPDHVDECDHYTAIRISWFSPRFGFVESTSHWMPLPEPPKEEKHE